MCIYLSGRTYPFLQESALICLFVHTKLTESALICLFVHTKLTDNPLFNGVGIVFLFGHNKRDKYSLLLKEKV